MILQSAPFPVLDLTIDGEALEPLFLPAFAGSVLRGAYGAALRRIACMTGRKACDGCPLQQTCPYPVLFEPAPLTLDCVGVERRVSNGSPPYVILPPKGGALILKKGQFFTFGMRLFGSGIERLPFVVQSWRQALARGLGPMRGRARLTGVWAVAPQADAPVALYDCDTGTLGAVLPENPVLTDGEAETTTQTKVTLDFRTPLRLQVKGRPLRPADITPRRLVGDVVRRVRILTAQCGTPAAQANVRDWPVETWLGEADGIRSDQALRWQDWRRYSRRQDQAMILGGVVGQMVWQEIPASVLSLLRLATRIHVGKETVFGFGEVSLA